MLVITNAKCCPSKIKKLSRRRILFQQGTIVSAICILMVICFLPPFYDAGKHIRIIQFIITIFMINYGWTLGPTTWIYLS